MKLKKIRLTQKNFPLVVIVLALISIFALSISQYGFLAGTITTVVGVAFAILVFFGLDKLANKLPKS